MEWTKEQKAVIDNRNGTLLISAAAGSGKTAVLVQRILDWVVKDGKNIDEFLVVTFTKAAASQMRTKIRNALEELQERYPENQHLVRQLSLIHRASITTIDSFCKEIVNEHFQTLGIDPTMRIMDETEGILLQEDVLKEILEQAYETKSEEMLELHQYMNALRSDDNIRGLIRRIHRQADSFPDPKQWLNQVRQDVMVTEPKRLEQQPWMQILVKEVRSTMEEVQKIPEQIALEYQMQTEYRPKTYEKCCQYFQEETQQIHQIMEAETYTDLYRAFNDSDRVYKRFAWKYSGIPESHDATVRWESYRKVKKEMASRVSLSLSEIQLQQQGVCSVLLTILDLTERFMNEYQKEKQTRNCMDFSDVEHYALTVLSEGMDQGVPMPTEVAKQLQNAYAEILIDEYQDSNDLQEAILTSIARREQGEYTNLFMVGDIKQSIYRFRMARPQLFQEKYERFSSDLNDVEKPRRIELKQNFRSRETVLKAINLFFYQLMMKSLGGIAYDDQIALVPGREFLENDLTGDYRTELLILDDYSKGIEGIGEEEGVKGQENPKEDSEEDEQDPDRKIELEARLAAARIHELCDSSNPLPVWDETLQDYRPCMYKDIVILLRTVRGWSEIFSQVLLDAGIPVYAESGKGYFDSVEVKNLLCILSLIDNARDDIALAGTLRSPLVSINSEELAHIRGICKQGDLWMAIHNYLVSEESHPEIKEKLEVFLKWVKRWKEKKTYSTIRELIWDILNTTGYYEYVGAMPSGKRRQGNILKLIEKASAYENTSYRGLFDFLRYIERMKITEQDFGEAVIMEGNDNLVQLMTIHKSKGLEFPVVLLCGCGKQFNQQDTKDTVLVDADCYLGVNYKNLEYHYFEKTEKRKVQAQHIKEENLAEELRILYVAMTRAQEKLILIGSVDSMTAKKNEDYHFLRNRYQAGEAVEGDKSNTDSSTLKLESLGKYQVAKGDSYLDWFIPCMVRLQNHYNSQSCLTYRIVNPEDLDEQVIEDMTRLVEVEAFWKQCASCEDTEETVQALRQRFEWRYPYPIAAVRKGKLSVSEIKKMSQLVDEDFETASSMEGAVVSKTKSKPELNQKYKTEKAEMNGATYGTLIHLVMEKLSFLQAESMEQIQAALKELKLQQIITEDEFTYIPVDKIYGMIHSGLGQRMKEAEQREMLYREKQFVIGIPMNRIYRDAEETDLELVQGIIDAYFEEDGELVLLDYKTDTVSKKNGQEELIQKYHTQLEYYKYTLEQLTGKTVKEAYIYSFCLDSVILMPLEKENDQ